MSCIIGIHNAIEKILNNKPWFKYKQGDKFVEILDSPKLGINRSNAIGVAKTTSDKINELLNEHYPKIGSITHSTFYKGDAIIDIAPTNKQLDYINSEDNKEKEQLLQQIEEENFKKDVHLLSDENFKQISDEEKSELLRQEQENKQSSLYGLDVKNQGNLEFHINTINVINQFLEKAGIEQRLVSQFLQQDGNIVEGALAAANFIQGTVDIINDVEKRPSAWNKLPEEAAHWWYRLLDNNSELKKALWDSHKTALKNDELYKSQYGKLVSKPEDLTEESIGQLIAEAIKRIETKNANASDYSFFKKFLEWVNSLIDFFKGNNKITTAEISNLIKQGEIVYLDENKKPCKNWTK